MSPTRHQLDLHGPTTAIFVIFDSHDNSFYWRKCISKCRLRNSCNFVSVSDDKQRGCYKSTLLAPPKPLTANLLDWRALAPNSVPAETALAKAARWLLMLWRLFDNRASTTMVLTMGMWSIHARWILREDALQIRHWNWTHCTKYVVRGYFKVHLESSSLSHNIT